MDVGKLNNYSNKKFNPFSLKGVELLFDVRNGVKVDDNGVYEWSDLSGNGNNFLQSNNVLKPSFDGVVNEVRFDGVNDIMKFGVNASNLQNLTYFEFWFPAYFDGTTLYLFSFTDIGVASPRFLVYFNGGYLTVGTAGAPSSDVVYANQSLSVGWHVVGVICTGSEYLFYINGVQVSVAITLGSNTGHFIGSKVDNALIDTFSLSALAINTVYYSASSFKYLLGLSEPTTENERSKIFDYINKSFNLGL